MDQSLIFKIIPILFYGFYTVLALSTGYLVYAGLTTNTERLQTRLRLKQSFSNSKQQIIKTAKETKAEKWFKLTNYPLGLNSTRYFVIYFSIVGLLIANYVLLPMLTGRLISNWAFVGIIAFALLFLPSFPYSLFVYTMKRIVEYRIAKKNAEIFMLYDLITNELRMMNNTRINSYNLLRNLRPYFDVISESYNRLLTNWTNDEGPKVALNRFADEIGSKEARALANIISSLDEIEIDTALNSLSGLNDMFIKSQIENYRRRKKVTNELSSLPIKATHFIIILNFVAVVIVMVMEILQDSQGF
ncbi:hypothetical protein [Terribacillus sp. DMT04]|uniref:hypothetical protein n=1 Tax=Terribacillus sp. DMT04 TaxID=2850441 RepID=UPI0020B768D7|nr:hypothetical protein [Terribacillus sp. DMT04]